MFMDSAIKLYEKFGFCFVERYNDNPAPSDVSVIRWILFAIGYLILVICTSAYIATGYPKMPIDGLNHALADYFHIALCSARLGLETVGFAAMILVKGPFGIGTVIFAPTVGTLISCFKRLFEGFYEKCYSGNG